MLKFRRLVRSSLHTQLASAATYVLCAGRRPRLFAAAGCDGFHRGRAWRGRSLPNPRDRARKLHLPRHYTQRRGESLGYPWAARRRHRDRQYAERITTTGPCVRDHGNASLLTARSDSAFASRQDTLIQRWRPIAKDAAAIPSTARTARLARQVVRMGETYDFEYTPARPGLLQLEIRSTPPPGIPVPRQLLIRVPIRAE